MRLALALLLAAAPAASANAPAADPGDSASCLRCHAAEDAPLARSRHGLAYSPGLAGQLPTEGPHRGSGLACLLCHAPAADQQPWRSLAPENPDAGTDLTPTEARSLAISAAGVRDNPEFSPHARALGVSCTACHVKGGKIVGAQPSPRAPHAVAVDPSLESPSLCARCHQFGLASAVNGKPLENTVAEFESSSWGRAGATCQSCHMPSGRHLFQGIHDRELVAASVEIRWTMRGRGNGELALTNSAVGHDFPSYTTPRVRLSVQPEDARGNPLGAPASLELGRKVHFEGGAWREDFDTRVPPGESRALTYSFALPASAARLHATVTVSPDASYAALYRELLRRESLPSVRTAQLQRAEQAASGSAFAIFDQTRNVGPR